MTSEIPRPPRVVLAGSVGSSRRTLQGLLRHRASVVGVLGFSPDRAAGVSGYARLDDLALGAGLPFKEFQSLNHPEVVACVRAWAPDLLFVVGLSELVRPELLAVPRLGCVGFHPTPLPAGRGRAPIAWLTLDAQPGAATFFLMEAGVDSGPILVQEPFPVTRQDYAADVLARLEAAIDAALDRWLPELLAGRWQPTPQDPARATYTGRRTPEDGLIDWRRPAEEIYDLVRAASRPHPGAYTYLNDERLVVWRADLECEQTYRGVIGRIVQAEPGRGVLVQTGAGQLWLTEVTLASGGAAPLRVGQRLGYAPEDEVFLLRRRLVALEARLARLEAEGGRAP